MDTSDERLEFLEKIVRAGKNKEAAEQELISQGYSNDNFADLWTRVQNQIDDNSVKAEPNLSVATSGEESPNLKPTAPANHSLTGVFALFTNSFQIAKARLSLTVYIIAAVVSLFLISLLFLVSFDYIDYINPVFFAAILSGQEIIIIILLVLVAVITYIFFTAIFPALVVYVTTYVLLKRSEEIGVRDGLVWLIKNIWPVSLIILGVHFVVTAGFALFIIPGVMLSIYLLFSNFVFVSENRGGLTALLRSTDLVRGRWWALLWRFLALSFLILVSVFTIVFLLFFILSLTGLLGILLGLIVFLAGCSFAMVWIIASLALLYESLAERKPPDSFKPDSYKTLRVIYLVLVIVAIPLIILSAAFDLVTVDEFDERETLTPQQFLESFSNKFLPNSDDLSDEEKIPPETIRSQGEVHLSEPSETKTSPEGDETPPQAI